MAKSIYGFSRGASKGSGVNTTEILRTYNLMVSSNADPETGKVNNPNVYTEARKILEPYSGDLQVANAIADSVNKENQLKNDLREVDSGINTFKQQFTEAIMDVTKQSKDSPETAILQTALIYNVAIEELEGEIDQRRLNGQSYDSLIPVKSQYEDKARLMSSFARDMLAGKEIDTSSYGWFVKTNPVNGDVISMEFDVARDIDKSQSYYRTNSTYGDVPVWTIPHVGDDDKMVAKVGDWEYELQDDGVSRELKLKGKGSPLRFILPGGTKPSEAKTGELSKSQIKFADALTLPAGSVGVHGSGEYYYFGADGKKYVSESVDQMKEFLASVGQNTDFIPFPITNREADIINSSVDKDGNSSVKKLNDVISDSPEQGPVNTPNLPGNSQNTGGISPSEISARPTISQDSGFSRTSTPSLVPRKEPGLNTDTRETNSRGSVSSKDVVANDTERLRSSNIFDIGRFNF